MLGFYNHCDARFRADGSPSIVSFIISHLFTCAADKFWLLEA